MTDLKARIAAVREALLSMHETNPYVGNPNATNALDHLNAIEAALTKPEGRELRNAISQILVKHSMPTRQVAISELAALSTQPISAVPEGWVCVPKEPTEPMWDAGQKAYEEVYLKGGKAGRELLTQHGGKVMAASLAKWKAMIAAAPPKDA